MNKGEKAVRYMRKMATGCHWRVLREIRYQRTDGSEFVLKPGVWYTGIPYTQGKRKRRYGLLKFRFNLVGGIFFFRKSLIGCDCSSAVSYAWRKINPKLPILSTRKIFRDLCIPQKYVFPKNDLNIPENSESTHEIIQNNSIEILYHAFDELEKGDFVVHEECGIGQFEEICTMLIQGVHKDFLKIKYKK